MKHFYGSVFLISIFLTNVSLQVFKLCSIRKICNFTVLGKIGQRKGMGYGLSVKENELFTRKFKHLMVSNDERSPRAMR